MAAPHVKNAPKGIVLVWDETNKDYVAWDGLGTPAITGFATETTLTLVANELKTYAIQYAVNSGDSTITYVGKAVAGSTLASASWQIKKITDTSGDLSIQFADGNANFDNVWNNRESLSYS